MFSNLIDYLMCLFFIFIFFFIRRSMYLSNQNELICFFDYYVLNNRLRVPAQVALLVEFAQSGHVLFADHKVEDVHVLLQMSKTRRFGNDTCCCWRIKNMYFTRYKHI